MKPAGFHPPRWLRNHHLQSILPTSRLRRPWVMPRAKPLLAASRPTVLDCGAGVRLSGYLSQQQDVGRPAATTLVVLLHGWEGSAQSLYVLALGSHLFDRGYDVFRLNFRDHGGSHGLNPGLFHSCRLDEVVGAVARLHELFPDKRLCIGGFSLGGNFALRVAARAPASHIPLERAFAVCPVLSPHSTLEVLERGPFVYRQYFIQKWKRSLVEKQRCFPEIYDLKDILEMDTMTAMTDTMVRRYSEFETLDAYLTGYAIVDGVLADLAVPSHALLAADDPIIPVRDADRLAKTPFLSVTHSRYGGHCGFLDSFGRESWVNAWVTRLLESPVAVRETPAEVS
jgi:predicted alpha/beta-fold hydrolase